MRIVSWNCNGALRRKFTDLQSLSADVYVVQECENPGLARDAGYRAWAGNALWSPGSTHRGLGVFAAPGLRLERVELPLEPLELFLPCVIDGRMRLLAAWTRHANSPTFEYIGQLWKLLQTHRDFLSAQNSALVGDLNSNACWDVWDRWWNHSDVVRELATLGLTSLYHHQTGEAQGAERTPTFYLQRKAAKPYHIDYAFLSHDLLRGAKLEVGDPERWLAISDHLPLIIDLD